MTNPPMAKPPGDRDLAEQQTNPGMGIPTQDPRVEAQDPIPPDEARREAQSAMTGGSMVAGAAAGAAVGTAVGGPVGTVVGAAVGAVAGTLGGIGAGKLVQDNPQVEQARDVPVKPVEPSDPAVRRQSDLDA